MNNIDALFHEFLCYLSKRKSRENPDKKQYYKQKVYYSLWDHFHNWRLDGICPPSMQAHLEHEKWMLFNKGLTEDEMLEVILLEKLMYSFYTGGDMRIAELTQNFTSRQLQEEHAALLEKLWESGKKEDLAYTYKTVELAAEVDVRPENVKENNILKCFLHIRMEADCLLELKKIELICRMLKEGVPRETIKKLMDINSRYLDTVSRFIHKPGMEIYRELVQGECVAIEFINQIDFDKLDFFESQVMQTLQYYFGRDNGVQE